MGNKSLVMIIKELMDNGKDPIKEMYDIAGNDIVISMMDIFGKNDEDCLDFFYSPNRGIGYESPYDYCKSSKESEVYDLLGRIEWGIFS